MLAVPARSVKLAVGAQSADAFADGGWVENSVATFPPASGLTMYIGAVAGLTASAGAWVRSISASASASGSPDPSSRAAVASARYSRCRETPSCSSVAAIGARIAAASEPSRPSGLVLLV